MPNTLDTLTLQLSTALRDVDNVTWTEEELQTLLITSCARTYPRVAQRMRESVTLVENQDQYELTQVGEIDRVDIIDEAGLRLQTLPDGTWEFWGDGESVGGTLYMNPDFAVTGRTLRVHGWAPYDLLDGGLNPPDRIAPWVLAIARAEAGRREIGRRMNSTNWQALNQVQNVSVNELTQMVNEADNESRQLRMTLRTFRRPRPGRIG